MSREARLPRAVESAGELGHLAVPVLSPRRHKDEQLWEPSLYTVKAVLILDNDGDRLFAKYYDDTYPTVKEQKAFEKNIFNKTHRTDSEIALLEGLTVVYKSSIDLYFYVIGSSYENELMLMAVLNCLFDSLSQMLRKNVEKRALLENMEGLFLAVDEIVDGGVILESDPQQVVHRVAVRVSECLPLPTLRSPRALLRSLPVPVGSSSSTCPSPCQLPVLPPVGHPEERWGRSLSPLEWLCPTGQVGGGAAQALRAQSTPCCTPALPRGSSPRASSCFPAPGGRVAANQAGAELGPDSQLPLRAVGKGLAALPSPLHWEEGGNRAPYSTGVGVRAVPPALSWGKAEPPAVLGGGVQGGTSCGTAGLEVLLHDMSVAGRRRPPDRADSFSGAAVGQRTDQVVSAAIGHGSHRYPHLYCVPPPCPV
ncbi:phosphatidylinositol 4,5-bisphosphate 5-phosphatase A [Platysternon megacephalum]|uniref:Phosphatidylinositol 4,5-bisphosphate 5-phosphatase A n=1 Tax=Platysternon megacephalum TaxID=55544 RepID=A0A4D9DV63_9SAUR|nr:phosphatidylinositol 4,5-bisphosphate 5-phosphatase A [Platysternon megacephalum]